eukprot:GEMP01034872.1.p1 GENE.GEMP01034872.1~~GEMP01034872.1.p1  ORF type:complete len:318 (+),score=63.64 GEMP01034872.1:312-1265(+)
MVTNGNTAAISLAVRTLVAPGETLIVDDPTYFLVKDIVTSSGANVVTLPSTEAGLDLDALEALLKKTPIKALYCIPVHHNPTGVSLSPENARRLTALAAAHDFYIIADEPYPLLRFSGSDTTLKKYDQSGRVLSLGSFSKIIAPGLRCGWIHCSKEVMRRLVMDPILRSGGGFNPIVSAILHSFIDEGHLDRHLAFVTDVLAKRCDRLCSALAKYIPDCNFFHPQGGYFVWVFLPDVDTTALWAHRAEYQVSFLPGPKCSLNEGSNRFAHHLRLSFAFYEEEEIEEGVRRLARLVSAYQNGQLGASVSNGGNPAAEG